MKTLTRPDHPRAGTTMVEVMIAAMILAAVMGVALLVMMTASSTAADATITGDLETRGRMLIDRSRSLFMTARFRNPLNPTDQLGMHVNNTMLWFQVPVGVNNSGGTAWGYAAALGVNDPGAEGYSCVLRFEAETILRESNLAAMATLPSSGPAVSLPVLPVLAQDPIRNIDVNRDGDLADTFVRGKIKQYILDPADAYVQELTYADNVILAVTASNQFNADFETGTALASEMDYLFRWVDSAGALVAGQWPGNDGVGIQVNVWFGSYGENGRMYQTRRCRETIRFKNNQ